MKNTLELRKETITVLNKEENIDKRAAWTTWGCVYGIVLLIKDIVDVYEAFKPEQPSRYVLDGICYITEIEING